MNEKSELLEFLEKQGGALMSFAMSMLGNRAEAEDACQDMVAQMLKHWEAVDDDQNLKSWAFTILYRKCLDQLKKRRRFLGFFRTASEFYQEAEREQNKKTLKEYGLDSLLGRLKPREKSCLLLWAQEGYNTEEIARIMNCAPGTVRVHLFQARKKLKKMVEKSDEKKD